MWLTIIVPVLAPVLLLGLDELVVAHLIAGCSIVKRLLMVMPLFLIKVLDLFAFGSKELRLNSLDLLFFLAMRLAALSILFLKQPLGRKRMLLLSSKASDWQP